MSIVLDGTTGITTPDLDSPINGLAYPDASSMGFRNRIINGDMRIDQRNNGAAFNSTAGADVYGLDRWFSFSGGATVVGQRVAGIAGFQNALRVTGATGNTVVALTQRIESFNSFDLAGQTVTVQVALVGSASGSVTWSLAYPNSTDNYSGGTTQINTGSINFTTSDAVYSFQVSIPSAATSGLQLTFNFGAIGAGVTRTITGVQLEAGSVATPFERRPYGQELALCQRYYWFNPLCYFSSGTALQISYKATMRVAPTIAFSHSGGVVGNITTDGFSGFSSSNQVNFVSATAEL